MKWLNLVGNLPMTLEMAEDCTIESVMIIF